jgi:hypothetical protein
MLCPPLTFDFKKIIPYNYSKEVFKSGERNRSHHKGNTEEENLSYVVFNRDIHGTASEKVGGLRGVEALLRPTHGPNI